MAYPLTVEDIKKLVAAGVAGAIPGEEATEEDLQILGVQPNVSPTSAEVAEGMATTLDPQAAALSANSMDPAAVEGAINAVPAAAPVTQEQLTAPKSGGLSNMLFGPPEATDQFSNLNRQQRMMLAFGAIKDAGFALQGKEGTAFSNTLKAINDQMDMGRKAKAAAQRQQLLGGLGLSGGGGDIEARRQAILGAAAQGLIDGPTAKLMIDDLQRQSDDKTQISSKMNTVYLIDSLMNNPDLPQILGVEGTLRGVADKLVPGLQETYADLMARVDQLKGGIFQEAFQSLRGGGQITELEGQKASDALARLNTAQGVDAFKEALREYRFYINQGIARLKGENIPLDTFYGGSQAGETSDPLGIRS